MRDHYKRGRVPATGEPVVHKNEWSFIHSGNILGRLYNSSAGLANRSFFHREDADQLVLAEQALARLQKRGLIYVTEFVEDGSTYDTDRKQHIPTKIKRRRYELSNPLFAIVRGMTDPQEPIGLA